MHAEGALLGSCPSPSAEILCPLPLFPHSQPQSQHGQGGRNWASCLTTLMLKRVEHSQATELC